MVDSSCAPSDAEIAETLSPVAESALCRIALSLPAFETPTGARDMRQVRQAALETLRRLGLIYRDFSADDVAVGVRRGRGLRGEIFVPKATERGRAIAVLLSGRPAPAAPKPSAPKSLDAAPKPSAPKSLDAAGTAWLPAEDLYLREHYATRGSAKRIARALRRSHAAVMRRAARLGIATSGYDDWTAAEDATLAKLWGTMLAADIALRLPGRTVRAIRTRRMVLGLARGRRGRPRRDTIDTKSDAPH